MAFCEALAGRRRGPARRARDRHVQVPEGPAGGRQAHPAPRRIRLKETTWRRSNTSRSFSCRARTARPSADNFRLVETPVAELERRPGAGAQPLPSLDPYMRGRMNDAKSYAAPQPLGRGDDRRHGRRGGRVAAPGLPAAATTSSAWAAGSSTRWSTAAAGRAAQGRHHARAALGVPRRGRHARRHRLVRPDEDLRAQGRPDDRRQRGQRRGRQRRRPARQGARLPRGRHRRRRPTSAATSSTSSASTPASTTRRTPTRRRSTRR